MKRKIITSTLTGATKIILLSPIIITLCLLNILFYSFDNSLALTYSSNAEVGFTFNPTISVNLSGDLLINNLSPGSVSDSNTINVNVSTNASQGYVLTATSGTKTTNTDLVNQTNSAYKFSSIATNASLSNLTTDNTWGFSYSEDSGTNWSNYSGLPLDNDDEGATGKQLINTINPADNRTLQFKIAARASSNQAAGTYINTINFYAVANPDPTLQPVSCPAGKVCYNANSLTTVQGEMGQQTANNGAEKTLWASNFKRNGYGFAGWADSTTYNGLRYGPNQTITAPSDISTNGYSLYAIWVKSAGDMQNWTGCSSLSQGEVTALKDTRDNDVYAVAKLADGKCWMIENLRLDDSATLSSINTHNPSLPLTNIYDTGATSNHLSPTSFVVYDAATTPEGWCFNRSAACDNQSRLSTINTALFTNNTSSNYDANGDVYSYGNYYNWYSATAGHGKYGTSYGNGYYAPGDICPVGWYLPTGGSSTADFNTLDISMGGAGQEYQGGDAGTLSSRKWRSYPNNFVLSDSPSSNDGSSILLFRGMNGSYWSSSGENDKEAYKLSFGSNYIAPGAGTVSYKDGGGTVRCIAGT
ncbi:hypothetical protein IJG12_01805 [Candidatus Saccharibacteria bacterium]|nr:hypothetical protein [Candidatus Saccharibacteria bacterium]